MFMYRCIRLLVLVVLLVCANDCIIHVSSWSPGLSTSKMRKQRITTTNPTSSSSSSTFWLPSWREKDSVMNSPNKRPFFGFGLEMGKKNKNNNNSKNKNSMDDTAAGSNNNNKLGNIAVKTPKKIDLVLSSGLSKEELDLAAKAMSQGYSVLMGHTIPVNSDKIQTVTLPSGGDQDGDGDGTGGNVLPVGATGRVLVAHCDFEEDSLQDLKYYTCAEIDEVIAGEGSIYGEEAPLRFQQPVLVDIINPNNSNPSTKETKMTEEAKIMKLSNVIKEEVDNSELIIPLPKPTSKLSATTEDSYHPSIQLEIDGAYIADGVYVSGPDDERLIGHDDKQSSVYYDTSSVVVFDNLIDDGLRKRLLDVTLGKNDDDEEEGEANNGKTWDDITNGPNPDRWERGGLMDVPDEFGSPGDEPEDGEGPCWGLRREAVEDICYQPHDALEEFELRLSELFPQFVITRQPEAVFGEFISPLTANAPTAGDAFDYHIDGDPLLTASSAWTDIYGRYPNRAKGKPRLMSCIIYLSDEWEEEWGAPTRFLDLPTETHYDILPRPGRCVLMDQDCSHTIVAPNDSAGKRPRYSLVWKLVLHPKVEGQDMKDLSGEREWPEPLYFGSAENKE